MKELTGGDRIIARALYKEPIEFKPMFKMALLCNHLPHVPSDDGGTWRRIRVVEFKSKFVDKPTRENEFPIDIELSHKFQSWAPHFMALLIEYYKKHAHARLTEPEEVLEGTRTYQKNNDHFADFMDTCLEAGDVTTDHLSVDDSFRELQRWISEDHIPLRNVRKRDMVGYMERAMGKKVCAGGRDGLKGYRVKSRFRGNDVDDIDG